VIVGEKGRPVAAWEGELDRDKLAPIALKTGRHARAAKARLAAE